MHHRYHLFLLIFSILILLSLACGLSDTASPTATWPPPSATATIPPTPTPEPDRLDACPRPSGETSLHINQADGYCFLYPASYTIQPVTYMPLNALQVLGPAHSVNKGFEIAQVKLTIARNGPAEDFDSQSYAVRYRELHELSELVPQPITFADQPAILFMDMPAMLAEQGVFIVTHNWRYTVTLNPQVGAFELLDEEARLAWEIVSESLVFFDPFDELAYISPEEVCPHPGPEQHSIMRLLDGVCYLYPADFEPDSERRSKITGGPLLDTHPEFGEVRASLSVGANPQPYLSERTPRQSIQNRIDNGQVVLESLVDLEIGGYPAVSFIDTNGVWNHQVGWVPVNGIAYSIVASPWEPDQYPLAIPFLERVWESVTSSIAFFTPWR